MKKVISRTLAQITQHVIMLCVDGTFTAALLLA